MVFRSKAAHPPKEATKVAPEPAPGRERTGETPPRKVQHSFISADTKVTGDLEGVGDISVEGSVEGNISCRTLTLQGQPIITGDVQADAVHVCGRFKGALQAKKVVLTKAARMSGDINYEILELHEGAEFEGGIRRTSAS
jgi:cytoskeletal protein CcmA (bactofilin family)